MPSHPDSGSERPSGVLVATFNINNFNDFDKLL
jgi:hypothetical protein